MLLLLGAHLNRIHFWAISKNGAHTLGAKGDICSSLSLVFCLHFLGQFNQFNTLNKPLLLILFQIKHLRWILWE